MARELATVEDFDRCLRKERAPLPNTFSCPPEDFVSPFPPEGRDNCLQGRRFVLNGYFMNFKKSDVKQQIQGYGGRVVTFRHDRVFTGYMVVGEDPNQTYLTPEATRECTVISYRQLIEMIQETR